MKKYLILILVGLFFSLCEKRENDNLDISDMSSLYFPPIDSNEWKNISASELDWNTSELENLFTYLKENNTRAFIVLKDGKIVIEEYFGKNIIGTSNFNRDSQWFWASAGKTLTATLVGIAQQEGFLNIENSTSDYLGTGWTSLTENQEEIITVKNQLTMTTGLDYEVSDLDCTLPSCLTYKTEPGRQWFYHNAAYTLLEKVVENATNINYNVFTDQMIELKIGMNGQWISNGFNNIYWSTARDMARFGLLMLNKGNWNKINILSDKDYYNQMINTSQTLNTSYGYLWWLNGKESIIFPRVSTSFNFSLSQNAPGDLFAGIGKDGQFLEIIPSKNMVVVRMGQAPDDSLVPIAFHNEMWEKINLVINK